jgi:glycosyltransferase involved in cell wall biosynthesis
VKRLLVFSFFPSFVPPSSGGELRLFNLYRELSSHYDVVLLSSSHHGVGEERVMHGARFTERRIPKCDRFVEQWQRLSQFASGGDLSAVCVAAAGRFGTPMHLAYLEEYARADAIIHDSPFTLPYDLFFGLDSKPRVYNSHNCESALFRQLHSAERSAPIHGIVDECERRLLLGADLVTYCSEGDLDAFEKLLGKRPASTLMVPNGLLPSERLPVGMREGPRPSAVFVGSGHLPNVEAARYIASELAPVVPGCDFHVIGDCLPEGRYPPNVYRHGRVDESTKRALLLSAAVGLNPMAEGSGSNLKVLEFFDSGLAVLTTPFGIRGFAFRHGEHCIVAERVEFSSTLRNLLANSELRSLLSAAGRSRVLGLYSWGSIAQSFAQAIASIQVGGTPRLLSGNYVVELNDFDPFASKGGGAIRIQGLLAGVDRIQPVVFLCFGENDEVVVQRIGSQSVLVRVPKTADHRRETVETNALHWVSVADIVSLKHAAHNPYMRAIYGVLRRNSAVILSDHVYMVALPLAFGDAFVYSSHNHETTLKRSLLASHPLGERLLSAVAAAEAEAARSSQLVVAVSDDDAQSFVRGVSTSAPIVVVRNGAMHPAVPTPEDVATATRRVSANSAVFIGSAHMPNVDACRFIVDSLAPALPEAVFHLVGAAGRSIPGILPPNVVVWGEVSDSLRSAILERCWVALNPMSAGSGSNVKLADYMGHGLHTLTTPFGKRGYPLSIDPHVTIADIPDWPTRLAELLLAPEVAAAQHRVARRRLFDSELSMMVQGEQFARIVRSLQQPRRRALFVTYRWLWPKRGGGEAHLLQYVEALARDGGLSVDVVAPDVSEIIDVHRFASIVRPTTDAGAPTGIPHVRFQRFPVIDAGDASREEFARAAWSVQPAFERAKYHAVSASDREEGLAWGWAWPDDIANPDAGRWGYFSCALHLERPSNVELQVYSVHPCTLLITDCDGRRLVMEEVSSATDLAFQALAGEVRIDVSGAAQSATDLRPLGIYLKRLTINGKRLDLCESAMTTRPNLDADAEFESLHEAMRLTRSGAGLKLTGARGPHSPDLEAFIRENAARYDLVLTHNTVFKTTKIAIDAARAASVPVVVVPHVHLDDDFYHFDDVTGMATQADLVLAAPRAACRFYERHGARRVEYLTPGCDTSEPFGADDVAAFRAVCPLDHPFVLVLGRKSAAKRYRRVIQAVDRLSPTRGVQVVLIGPDDDATPVNSQAAFYLGMQPRSVVRGALQECIALVNMSSSESFGIVVLEAWLARKPVIVNRRCAAFADLVEHGSNALLVDDADLETAIETLLLRPGFAAELGMRGHATAQKFDHRILNAKFVQACLSLMGSTVPAPRRATPQAQAKSHIGID